MIFFHLRPNLADFSNILGQESRRARTPCGRTGDKIPKPPCFADDVFLICGPTLRTFALVWEEATPHEGTTGTCATPIRLSGTGAVCLHKFVPPPKTRAYDQQISVSGTKTYVSATLIGVFGKGVCAAAARIRLTDYIQVSDQQVGAPGRCTRPSPTFCRRN